jgi:hypothetical protein
VGGRDTTGRAFKAPLGTATVHTSRADWTASPRTIAISSARMILGPDERTSSVRFNGARQLVFYSKAE